MQPGGEGSLPGEGTIELFVPGRICLFGEHSDWAGGYRRFNADINEGCALVCGTSQGLYANARKIPGRRILIYRGPDGAGCELALDDIAHLREVARSPSVFSYIAGTVLELGKHFRVDGAEVVNYKADLPIKKGLSSSAAICVLITRALNQLYDLKLTVHGEMDIAYRGEIQTPSRCGRLDQCVAFGQCVTKMNFDGDLLQTDQVRVGAPLYFVIVDLCAGKDTKEILKCLNEAYPFPKNDKHEALHQLLGKINLDVCEKVCKTMAAERDPTKMASVVGALMSEAQERWDKMAVPMCPHELTAPVLHKLLASPELQRHITGGKGVGSQGDGTGQLVCRSAESQDEVMKIVQGLGMEPLRLTIAASKSVRIAVVPIAGFCPAMWPATKCAGPWLFPIVRGKAVKPAICWLCEELIAAGIERLLFVVSEATEAQMSQLFRRREDVQNLNKVPTDAAAFDEELMQIGRKLTFIRQDRATGISDAVLLCESYINNEPFLLAYGDHLSTSTDPNGQGCVAQLLSAFDNSKSLAAIHIIDRQYVSVSGVFACKEPPCPLPPPLGDRMPEAEGTGSIPGRWPISSLAEKPTIAFANAHLTTPCLQEGQFFGSFGQYVIKPEIFSILRSYHGHFVEAMDDLRKQDGLDGVLIEGRRWDLGNTTTYIEALQAQAQAGEDQEPPFKRQRS